MNPITLTRMIADYWHNWVTVSAENTTWAHDNDYEGLFWYDGHNATFWYMLNLEWYRMNDKLFAASDNTEPFDVWLNDLNPEYIDRYYK